MTVARGHEIGEKGSKMSTTMIEQSTVTRKHLHTALAALKPAVGGKRSTEQLRAVTLFGSCISAFNYDTEISVNVPGLLVDQACSVDYLDLVAVVKAAPVSATLTLSAEAGRLTIEHSGIVAHLDTVDDMPDGFGDIETFTRVDLAGDDFRSACAVTIAAGTDTTLPVLMGVQFEYQPGLLTTVTTDRYRMAVQDVLAGASGEGSALIPARFLAHAAKVTSGYWDVVNVQFGDRVVRIESGAHTFTTRLLDGQFPNWRRLLPDTFTHECSVDSGELARAVGAVKPARVSRNVPMRMSADGQDIAVTVVVEDVERARASVSAEGDWVESAFNADFLLDAMTFCKTGRVQLSSNGGTRPLVITPECDKRRTYLLMPVRLV